MSGRSAKRIVAGTIDAGGVYTSQVAAGGDYVFFAGTAIGENGRLAAEAIPELPYRRSAAAQARIQTRYLFQRLRSLLPEVGSSVEDLVQIEQYVGRKAHVDGYFAVALGKGAMETDRPGGATVALGELYPPEAVVSLTGLGIVRDLAAGPAKSYPGEEGSRWNPARRFPEMVAAGPYVCMTYLAADPKFGIDPAVRADPLNWRGSEIRSEAESAIEFLKGRLATVGSSLADVVDYTLYLTDTDDLYEFDLVFGKALGDPAPTRTIVPSRGFQVPRREDAFGHEQGALRVEMQFRCLRSGTGSQKVAVAGPEANLGFQSAGMRVDSLLWMSSQLADLECLGKGAPREIDNILQKIEAVCRNGGSSLSNLLRVRALVTRPDDALAVYAALKKAIPRDPPAVCIIVVPPPLVVDDATVAVDAAGYVDGA